MKYVMFYQLAADGMAKAPANFAAHKARLDEFHQKGSLLMAGPYGSPPQGAMAIFTTRAAAEEFALDDPFVVNGVVSEYTIHEWAEALAP